MCCTLEPAELSNTILYAGEATREGRYVHVLGYQNRAKNLSEGPNAMILPIPASAAMGPSNVIDTSGCKKILSDLSMYALPGKMTKGSFRGLGGDDDDHDSLEVFDSGQYTIVMSTDATAIPGALERVPVNKRPRMNDAIFEAYAKWYPSWSIALCCFEAKSEVEPEPMIWWYEPRNRDFLFAPGLDGHDGQLPRIGSSVKVSADLIVGSQISPSGLRVRYSDTLSPELRALLPTLAFGQEFRTKMPNGDYVFPVGSLKKQRMSVRRLPPPGVPRVGV